MLVKAALEKCKIKSGAVELGEVELISEVSDEVLQQLRATLMAAGLEIMDNKKAILIDRIKRVIIDMIHGSDDMPLWKNSEYLSSKLKHDYTYLANLFSQTTGTTIEHYIILQKIERVKELLLYDELNLTEIAHKLNYSSVAHLSSQFKKTTGLTASFFKKLRVQKRIGLERL